MTFCWFGLAHLGWIWAAFRRLPSLISVKQDRAGWLIEMFQRKDQIEPEKYTATTLYDKAIDRNFSLLRLATLCFTIWPAGKSCGIVTDEIFSTDPEAQCAISGEAWKWKQAVDCVRAWLQVCYLTHLSWRGFHTCKFWREEIQSHNVPVRSIYLLLKLIPSYLTLSSEYLLLGMDRPTTYPTGCGLNDAVIPGQTWVCIQSLCVLDWNALRKIIFSPFWRVKNPCNCWNSPTPYRIWVYTIF